MISHGCGVSMYPQLYDQHLEEYQVLPRSYLGCFEGGNGELQKKIDVRLGRWSWKIICECIEKWQQINIGKFGKIHYSS